MQYKDFEKNQTVWAFNRSNDPPTFEEFYLEQLVAGKSVAPLSGN